MIYAGIDWADDHHDCVVINSEARVLNRFRVRHSSSGLAELAQLLSKLGQPQQVACFVEIRQGILVNSLLEAGFLVYSVNPKLVEHSRAVSGAKTDTIDALLLARYGLHQIDRLHKLEPDSPVIQELRELVRDQQAAIEEQTRLLNQLSACLKQYYPCALQFFSNLNGKVALAFLVEYPSVEHVRAIGYEHLAAFLHKRKHPRPRLTAQHILSIVHDDPLTTNAITTRTKARRMLTIVSQLTQLVEAISGYDEEIERLFLSHSDSAIFRSIPGAGKRLAPRLLAEWGDDRGRYASFESVAALAGTSPVPFQSGRMNRAHKRMACIKPFRDTLYKLAWMTTLREPWAAQYYERKRKQGKSHSMAIRALSNVWVRIIHRMWMDRACYSRETFLNAQVRHQRVA